MFNILTSQKIKEVCSAQKGAGKHVCLISGDWEKPYAVAVVVNDHIKAAAELHKNNADVWQVVSGKATFILGGQLSNSHGKTSEEDTSGNIIADEIVGGKSFLISTGDVIDVPAGVAHQIDATGSRVELIIVKINNV